MPDHRSTSDPIDVRDSELLDDGWDLDERDDVLPPRRRRRLLTPATGVCAAVLLLAAGFIGGVEVQKHQGTSSSSRVSSPAGARAAAFGGGRGFGGFLGRAGGAAPTVGQVANKRGGTLYVTTTGGTTVKVLTNAGSKLTRTAATSARGIHPGDTVVVTGSRRADGTVMAARVTATAKGTTALGAGFLGGGRFGGGGFGGGAAPGGSG